MTIRIGRFRRKTRHKLSKKPSDKGKFSIRDFLRPFKVGDRVVLKAEPAIQKGMYFPRFHGKEGIVNGKKGNCYEILIKDFKKEKIVVVHPVHLKKV